MQTAVIFYWRWKELSEDMLRSFPDARGLNFPEAISEAIGCWCLGFSLSRGTKKRKGDAADPATGEVIQFKATSNFDKDLSSFGPDSYFDRLYFLRLNKKADRLYIYDLGLSSETIKELPVTRKETFKQQAEKGRRPRLSLITKVIKKQNLKPVCIFDFKNAKILAD